MALTSNYPNGFSSTLVVRGLPVSMSQPGKVWWLNNSSVVAPGAIAGSDANPGTYQRPFSSLPGALTAIAADGGASRGDILMVSPGHAETISNATSHNLNVIGLMIIGNGSGNARPTFTYSTANTATITVSAAQTSIVNCRFQGNFLNITAAFTVTARDFRLVGCRVADNSSVLGFARVLNMTAAATNACVIEDCMILSSHATNAFSVVACAGIIDQLTIDNNYIRLSTTNAAAILLALSPTKNVTNASFQKNKIMSVGAAGTTTGLLITTDVSTNTGIVCDNYIQNLDGTTPILATASSGFVFFQNFYASAADKSGALLPVV
jgi:hypothetical protein